MNIIGNLDQPVINQVVNHNAMIIQGYCFTELSQELIISISIDNLYIQDAAWGLPRFDIFKKYQTENAYESGFIARIPLSDFKDGEHELKISIKNKNSEKILDRIIFIKELKYGLEPIPLVPTGIDPNFKKFGNEILHKFIDLGNLTDTSTVLDIGCGMGRMGLPVNKFLKEGKYYGIDIIKFVIDYSTQHIATRFSNSNFIYLDVYNQLYNTNSSSKSESLIFPFSDNQFDFVFLISVFTHMLPNDLLNYLKEISRILKTNGRCFATFFIINKAKLHNDNFTSFFKFIHENYRLKTENIPEEAIAYEENYLKEIFSNLGFKTIHPFHPIKIKDQDFIILEK